MTLWRPVVLAGLLFAIGTSTAALAQDPPPATTPVVTDSDGDSKPDAEDKCPKAFGTTENGCPTATTTISIFYSNKTNKFSGRIVSSARPCIQRRTVTLQKYRGNRTVTVATGKTDARGVWRIRRGRSKGSYIVRLAADVVPNLANCQGAASDRLKQH